MTTSLVTGGAGFIGSHVAAELLEMGHEVVVLDDLSGGREENVPEGAAFVKMSICDNQVNAVCRDIGFDYVFHLAAYAAEGLSHFVRGFNYENNLGGSVNLINAAVRHGVRRFVFTSSLAVYGVAPLPMIETMTPHPVDPYGIAKHAVELDLAAAHELWGLDYTIFRPHNVYGPRQNIADPYRNVVGIFMRQCLAGEPMSIFGSGAQTRAFSYIDDVAPVIARSVTRPEASREIFNIGGDRSTTITELARLVAAALGADGAVTHYKPRHEVVHTAATHHKVRDLLGPLPAPVPLLHGITEMAAWARDAGPYASTGRPPLEVVENLPEFWQ